MLVDGATRRLAGSGVGFAEAGSHRLKGKAEPQRLWRATRVLAGVGGWAGLIVSNDLDARDGTAARGFVNAMKDLPGVTSKGGMLYVFRIP